MTNDGGPLVLDKLKELALPASEVGSHRNELSSLGYLWEGLEFLFKQVATMEEDACRRVDCEHHVVWLYLNAPQLQGIPQGLVAASFHWYAVTACNYVRLVGWLGSGCDEAKARAYLTSVMPKVKLWRDKVGAHFAILKPTKSDTPAALAASVMFPIGFVDRRFVTSPVNLTLRVQGITSTSPDMRWSVTEVHEELRNRYSAT